MFLIYTIVSYICLFTCVFAGKITPQMAQIWVLTTLSIGSITYALEMSKKDK